MRNALDAFIAALAQTVQKNDGKHSTTTDIDSETVWKLLSGSTLLKIDDGNVKGGMIFQIDSPT
jgi:hypothetical protein